MRYASRFPVGGGAMGDAIRSHDWSSTPLGPIDGWPAALRISLSNMLNSPESMYLVWGPALTLLFNDAYRPILGPRLDEALGRPLPVVWPDAWGAVRPAVERAFAGKAGRFVDDPIAMARHGTEEATWWSYSFSPIFDGPDVSGILCLTTETSDRVLARKRSAFLLEIIDALRGCDASEALIEAGCERLGLHLGADRCGFAEYDSEGGGFQTVGAWTDGDGSVHGVTEPGLLAKEALRAGRCVRIDAPPHRRGDTDRATLCVPVMAESGLAAAVLIERAPSGRWTDEEDSLVRDVSGRIFASYRRLRAQEALSARHGDLEAALTATRESQARLSMAVGIARLGIFEWDTVTGAVEMDGRSREIFGLAAEGPVHQDQVFSRLEKVDVERAHALTEAAGVDGAEVVADYRVTRPDGTTRTILSSSEPLHDDGGHLRMIGVFHDVTMLRQAETDLRNLNADLERQVIERTQARGRTWTLTPDLMCALDRRGRFVTSNPAWKSMLGWTEDEVARMPIWEFLHPDDVERTRAGLERTMDGQPAVGEANRYRCKDGSYRWISWIGVTEDGLVYCTGRDVTVEKEREAALAARTAERDLLATIVESDAAPICAFDHDFRLIAFNQAHSDEFHRIFGYRVKLGDVFPDLFTDDQSPIMRALMARALAGEVFSVVEEFGDPSIVKPYWEVSYTPLRDEAGQIFGAFHHAHDITERVRAAAELDRAQDALRQAQKMEAVGQLTGGVAHDFNNLLTVIMSSTDLLKRPNLSEERRQRYIGAISDTVTRAAKLTGQLLAFARRQALKPEVFDAARSVETIEEMVGTLTGSRIRTVTRLPAEACFIDADPSQFETAIVNMAVNARDAMDGEGKLTISVRTVVAIPADRVHARVGGSFVAISISDTGTGIDAGILDRIFEPFFTTKEVGHGTGLGLSQVIGFAKQSGGEVRVASVIGEGTTFTLYLPRATEEAAPMVDDADPDPLMDGHGTRVLLVEDNRDVGTFASQTLHDLGYETVWAMDARQALAELGKAPDRFDVVFSDVVMPGMDGVELAREIGLRHGGLPVVLASGYSHVLSQNGTNGLDLLHKPYSVEQLSRILRKVTTRRRQIRDAAR
ncbi:PAS domain S-box protein [Methylobacterium sp. E-045]|uniref:PAS domain S-box protein n=1 Tax=Methylobacterium sp. E-045 TaxID=2836575 RepID=UPI001FB9DB37|nr:PAS domain S-box protein [Methylobacterium sp. E-045]MCJ2129048.1 PAS domain S-box protein [Methylobacterium sp. E-045]